MMTTEVSTTSNQHQPTSLTLRNHHPPSHHLPPPRTPQLPSRNSSLFPHHHHPFPLSLHPPFHPHPHPKPTGPAHPSQSGYEAEMRKMTRPPDATVPRFRAVRASFWNIPLPGSGGVRPGLGAGRGVSTARAARLCDYGVVGGE